MIHSSFFDLASFMYHVPWYGSSSTAVVPVCTRVHDASCTCFASCCTAWDHARVNGTILYERKAQLYGPYNNVHSFGSSHSFSASPKFEILLKLRLQANFETNCNCSAAPRNGICLLFPSCSIIKIGVVGMTRYYLYAYSSTRVQLIQYPYATNTTSSTIMLAALLPEGLLYSI